MAGITLTQAEENLTEALAALSTARKSASYSIGGRSISHQELKSLQNDVIFWNKIVNELSDSNEGIIISQMVPTDD